MRFDSSFWWSSWCRRLVRKRWEGVLGAKATRGWFDSHHLEGARVQSPARGVCTQSVMRSVAICLNLMGRQRLSAETMDAGNYFRRGERKSAINICMHGEFWPLWDISWLNWAENLEIKEGRLKILNCLNFIARKADWSRTAGLNVLAKNRRHWQVNFIDSGLKVEKNEISEISPGQKCVIQIKLSNSRISCTWNGARRSSLKVLWVTKRGYAFETNIKR